MAMKPLHRVGQCGLLVVHRHHDVEHGHACLTGDLQRRSVAIRIESGRGATFEGGFGHDFIVERAACVARWPKLYAGYEFFGG